MGKTPAAMRARLDEAVRTLDAYKLAAGCADCGYREHPQALQFDHRDPRTKRADIGWYPDRSKLFTHDRLRRFLAHVDAYCDVRCANCHIVRTMTEQHWRAPALDPGVVPVALF